MKKTVFIKLRKAVAILVAVALLATLTAVVPVAAETATSYNGTLFNYVQHTSTSGLITDSQRDSTEFVGNITANVHYVKGETEITAENYGTEVNYYSYSAQSSAVADLSSSDAVSWTENTAVMFYVKLPSNMAETKLYLEVQSKTDEAEKVTYSGLSKNATAYLLDNASIQWESTTTATLGVSKKSGAGSITLPAGFEGWVRVPAEAFSNAPTVAQKIFRIDFYFNNYSATEYTAYGALMVVDNATENLTSLTLGENTINLIETAAYTAQALSLGEFSSNDYYSLNADGTSNAQTAGVFDKGISYNLSVTPENVEGIGYKDDFYTADYANYVCQGGAAVLRTDGKKDTSWATFAFNDTLPVTFNGSRGFDFAAITEFVGNEQSKSFNIGLKSDSNSNSGTNEDIVWSPDRSMLFYVKTTGTKANKLSFIAAGADTADGTIYSRLVADQKYYLLANGSVSWQESTTAVAYEGSWGYIDVPAGFEGFVRIPCNGLLRNGKTAETGKMYTVHVYPYNLGGDYGELTIGAFGTVDKTTENLMYISSAATDNKPIFMASGTAYSVIKTNPTGNKSTAKTTGYTWDGKTVSAENLNTETLQTGTQVWMEISSAPITSEGAILFYTESTSDAIATGGVNGQIWSCTYKNNPYYLLADGASDWTENTIQSGGENNNGYIEIPANYKGWVMIPVSSFNTNLSKNNTEITKFGFWPKTLNGSISFSNIMTTDIADVALYVNDGEKIASLFDINNTFDSEMVSFNVSVNEGNITTDASVYALNATAVTTEEAALGEDKGLMFFAKTSNAVKFGLELSDDNTLNDEFTYYTIEHNGLWTENSVTDGNISLEASFEGWIRISANAFKSYVIDYVAIGFAEACDCIISDFMIIDQSAYDLDYIVLGGKKYSLFVELYDANADGEIDIRDLVRMKRYTAMVEGVKVPELASDIDRADGVNANDVTSVRKRLINGPENTETEVALSRYLADEGYTTAATYKNSTATVDNVNF